jgi:hypothetical protein
MTDKAGVYSATLTSDTVSYFTGSDNWELLSGSAKAFRPPDRPNFGREDHDDFEEVKIRTTEGAHHEGIQRIHN